MSVTFSGSLDITGSLFVNGTAVSTGSGGSVPASVTAGGNFMYNYIGFVNPDYIINVPSASVVNIHVSQSGNYLASGSFTAAQSASVNIYFYPDELSVGDTAQVFFSSLGSVLSNSVRFTFTGIISGSASQRYYSIAATLYNATTTILAGTANTDTRIFYRAGGAGTGYPIGIYKVTSTKSLLYSPTTLGSSASTFEFSGSIGTPIV
jgi:hypothetical protein